MRKSVIPLMLAASLVGSTNCLGDAPKGTTIALLGAGHQHACIINTFGELECWGRNNSGEIIVDADGDGICTTIDSSTDIDNLISECVLQGLCVKSFNVDYLISWGTPLEFKIYNFDYYIKKSLKKGNKFSSKFYDVSKKFFWPYFASGQKYSIANFEFVCFKICI